MIEYRYLNKRGLKDFLDSDEFKDMPHVPISLHRGIAHLHNPRLEAEDTLLILAYEDNIMLGYLGVIPDFLFLNDKVKQKFGCLSCLWITPEGRGKGLGSILLGKGVESWNGMALLSDYVPQTYKIYEKAGVFSQPKHIEGLRLYIRMDTAKILPPKNKIFKKILPFLKIGDRVGNLFLDIRFVFGRDRLKKLNIEYIDSVNDEVADFINLFLNQQLIRRGKSELNWILNYPWVKSDQMPDRNSRRYYFSSVDRYFKYQCVILRDTDENIVAFLMFLQRNNDLKLPYAYFHSEYIGDVSEIINGLIVKWKINTFSTFSPELVAYMGSHDHVGLIKKRVVRNYILSKDLSKVLDGVKFNIMDGDADDGFT